MSLDQKLATVVARHAELSQLIAHHAQPGAEDYRRKMKEYADLTPVVESIGALDAARRELADLEALKKKLTTTGDDKFVQGEIDKVLPTAK